MTPTSLLIVLLAIACVATPQGAGGSWLADPPEERPAPLRRSTMIRAPGISISSAPGVPRAPWSADDYDRLAGACVDMFEEEYLRSFDRGWRPGSGIARMRRLSEAFEVAAAEAADRACLPEGRMVSYEDRVCEVLSKMSACVEEAGERRSGPARWFM